VGAPGRKKTEAKQQAILAAAAEVFDSKDFHGVLMEEVAARAGVGKGTLYRYFPTKADLYFATILAGIDELRAEIETIAGNHGGLRDTLEAIAAGLLRFTWSKRPVLGLLHQYEMRLRSAALDPGYEARWLERRGAIASAVARLFAAARDAGEIRDDDPRLLAELFLGMVRSANLYRKDGDDPDELGRRVVSVLVEGLAGRPRERARKATEDPRLRAWNPGAPRGRAAARRRARVNP
jgi:AcrR family transcriptional regulator